MANMLGMATFKIRDPVLLVILVKSNDFLLHGVAWS